MSKATYYSWMEAAGWTKRRVENDAVFDLDLGDRVLKAWPTFSKTTTQLVIRDYGAVWFEDYARAKHAIFPNLSLDACAILRRKNARMKIDGEGSPKDVLALTEELRDWALAVDKAAVLDEHAAEKPQYGMTSYDHLAALALLGRVEAIDAWRDALSRDAAERYHPRIGEAELMRAREIAERKQA